MSSWASSRPHRGRECGISKPRPLPIATDNPTILHYLAIMYTRPLGSTAAVLMSTSALPKHEQAD